MVSKDRKRLIKFGMQKEFDEWKQNLPKNTKENLPLGTFVRFKKRWHHPFTSIEPGTEGRVVKNLTGYEGLLSVRPFGWPEDREAHITKRHYDDFLEIL